MKYLHRIDPAITLQQAEMLLQSHKNDLPKLTPKGRKQKEITIMLIEHDIAEIKEKQ